MTLEQDFMKELLLAIGSRPDMRVHRQNSGSVATVYNGKVGRFHAGPPKGAADISGICSPDGLRIEIETKGAQTKNRLAQDAWAAMIRRHGGVYVRVRYDESQSMEDNIARVVREIEAAITRRREIPMSTNEKRNGESGRAPLAVRVSRRAKAGTR